MTTSSASSPLLSFHPAVAQWFAQSFAAPTQAQQLAWPALARGESTLLLAPTGSGKTLAAFLAGLDRLMFRPQPPAQSRCRIIYVSPLKALAVDVERNLRAPLAGIANVAATRAEAVTVPEVWIRTGDTPSRERARFLKHSADILITTPESLYLMLTSQARQSLAAVETIIIDEIHALVATKRGAHLALSLERLQALCGDGLQRVGLSATQRPLDEVARFLGGVQVAASPSLVAAADTSGQAEKPPGVLASLEGITTTQPPQHRPVTVVDAGHKRQLRLSVEVPVEDLSAMGQVVGIASGPASAGPVRASIWAAIHPRLLQLIRSHTSTLIFVNSRRIAERLAAALNELAGEVLVHAHHGSLALAQRTEIEDRLKRGQIQALVATSSLELGIDMGALDLVVQIEAPPSVASGLQRIGRAGHHVGGVSAGIIFPKYRADLLACAAVTRAMSEGAVEATRYPRNPLDVLAQQIVAILATDEWHIDALFALITSAAPYAQLPRGVFENLLDMLAGRYESDDFAELRPRITWDRTAGSLVARDGAKRIAITNGGTIPDRGLYGVYLAGAESKTHARVGELDEEMVFESRVGETFVLGASSWRIEEITFDRVLVSPAPGEPGKMPFWRGDAAGRSVEIGRRMGALVRKLHRLPASAAVSLLQTEHSLQAPAAEHLYSFLREQAEATQSVPDDRNLIIERVRDEMGDFRVCILSPFGGKVHAPWAMAIMAKVREETGKDVEVMWTDDGVVARFAETDDPPDSALMLPTPQELEALVLRQLGSTALFAAKFREAASRALLLPRRNPARRAPLWQTRKRASDLLSVAARQGSFPMLLESYRECLRDSFDLPALIEILTALQHGQMTLRVVDRTVPSPFAASLLFGFAANYIYEGDAPLPERRAQALAIDHAQLRELLGDTELRELIDPDVLATLEAELSHPMAPERVRTPDAVADLLLRLGDLSLAELQTRVAAPEGLDALASLLKTRRAIEISIAGVRRVIAAEHASRYRDALGCQLPGGLPDAFLRATADPSGDLLLRYARTHGPFPLAWPAKRFGLPEAKVYETLARLVAQGKLLEGVFRNGADTPQWCTPDIWALLRRRSLAKLRRAVEPVAPEALCRALTIWQGTVKPRQGLDAVLDAVEKLQGAPLPASLLESDILPARVEGYLPGDLDALAAAGEVVWAGVEALGAKDGRVALFLTDNMPTLWTPPEVDAASFTVAENQVLAHLRHAGASFFADIHAANGAGFPGDTVAALWSLVFKGLVTNDTVRVLRAYTRPATRQARGLGPRSFRSRRAAPAAADGRWSLIVHRLQRREAASITERVTARAQQLLARYGIVSREVSNAEAMPGGFSGVYEALKAMEDTGRVRRGYFVTDVAATQFASPAALDLLRSQRSLPETTVSLILAAVDPANPYGAILPWPPMPAGRVLARTVGAHVVIVNGHLAGYLARGGRSLWVWLSEDEPDRSHTVEALTESLIKFLRRKGKGQGALISEINGEPALGHSLSEAFVARGFIKTHSGLQLRRLQPERGRPDAGG